MLPFVLQRIKRLGLAIFENGDWNLNIFGIRSSNRKSGDWDDALGVVFKIDDQWICRFWDATTDPGTKYLKTPINVKGTAILVGDQQYRSVYEIDKHQGKYDALCQRGAVKVYRDGNRDDNLDLFVEKIEEGQFGINIHRAHKSKDVEKVEGYSAGCQVFRRSEDFDTFLEICRKQQSERGWSKYTYTLLNEW